MNILNIVVILVMLALILAIIIYSIKVREEHIGIEDNSNDVVVPESNN